jgi:hypothetical protein
MPVDPAKCPFCQNDVLAGATVCGHCNAFMTKKPRAGCLYQLTWLAAMGLGVLLGVAIQNLIVLVFAPIFIFLLFPTLILPRVWPMKWVWVRRN